MVEVRDELLNVPLGAGAATKLADPWGTKLADTTGPRQGPWLERCRIEQRSGIQQIRIQARLQNQTPET